MKYTTMEEIHKSSWGIVEGRRADIEASSFGHFDKILAEEIDRQFPTAKSVAAMMDCSESTARRWLHDSKTLRWISYEGQMRFEINDVMAIVRGRRDEMLEKAAKAKQKHRKAA